MWSGMALALAGAVAGPFEAAQGNFFRQQVIPLCTGGFGEIGEDFDKVITRLVREAAAGDHGLRISPLSIQTTRVAPFLSSSNSSGGVLSESLLLTER